MSENAPIEFTGEEHGSAEPEFSPLGDNLTAAVTDTGLKLSMFEDGRQFLVRLSAGEAVRLRGILNNQGAVLDQSAGPQEESAHEGSRASRISITDFRQQPNRGEIPTNRSAEEAVEIAES